MGIKGKRDVHSTILEEFKHYRGVLADLKQEVNRLKESPLESELTRRAEGQFLKVAEEHQQNITQLTQVYAREKEMLERRLTQNQALLARYQCLLASRRQQLDRDLHKGLSRRQDRRLDETSIRQSLVLNPRNSLERRRTDMKSSAKLEQGPERKSIFIDNPISINFNEEEGPGQNKQSILNYSAIATELLCEVCGETLTPQEFMGHLGACQERRGKGPGRGQAEKERIRGEIRNLIEGLTERGRRGRSGDRPVRGN